MHDQNEKGLTLLEVMIALFVFSVGILSVAHMQVNSLKASGKATKGMYDTTAAAILMEEILSWQVNDKRLKDGDNGFHPDQPDHGPFPIDATGSTLEWEVADDFAVKDMKRISVTVNGKETGVNRRYTYEYVKCDHAQ